MFKLPSKRNFAHRHALFFITPVIVASLLIQGCKKTEETYSDPIITFKMVDGYAYNDTTLVLGDSIKIGIIAETRSDAPLTHFHYSIQNDTITTDIDSGFYANNLNFEKQIAKNVADLEKWSFYVRDRDGRKSETISIILTKDTFSTYGSITQIPSLILGAQNHATENNFYSLTTYEEYSLEEAFNNQSLINLIYFYDFLDGDENTISSPGANIDDSVFPGTYTISNWTTRNTTRFIQENDITIQEFDNAQNDSLILHNTFEFSAGKRKAKNLSANKIFSFVTEDGKRGLFRVVDIKDTDQGSVEISIKVED